MKGMNGARRIGTRLLAIAMAMAAAACGADEDDTAAVVVDTTVQAVGPVLGTDTFPVSATEPGATDDRTVSATLTEWEVQLSQDTVPAGEVTFRVANAGTMEHALEVEGQGIEEETAHIAPGQNATLTVNLQPGTYEVYCPVVSEAGNHQQLGMTAQLVVR